MTDPDHSQPLSEFEAAILKWIASETTDSALRTQLAGMRVADRDYTGTGCFSTLVPPADAPITLEPYGSRGPLGGPLFQSPAVDESGGGTLLWFKDGRADCLEIYAFGDYFPEDHTDLRPFTLAKAP